ncbi:MAG: LptF/LptG family permease [Rickettsiales bacterium]|jgi:lipopolysaccharide export LptBFGC system permease protein LptF|nr:LptF/LptG family permease [Rickettsiales bacterium]
MGHDNYMSILGKYFSTQVWTAFIGFGLVLGGLAWMVQILLLMKLIVKYGVDIAGFLGLSLHTLPLLFGIIMPFVVFIAVMSVYNRMIESSEITVCMGCGLSPRKVARPAIVIGAAVMMFHFALNLWVIPKSQDSFYNTQWELRYGLGHLKLRESAFNQMMSGVVIYVEQVSQKNLFGIVMRDGRIPNDERIISSENGRLVNTPNGLSIAMGIGGLQMGGKNGKMIGTFDGAQMDLEMMESSDGQTLRARRLNTGDLIKTLRNLENYSIPQRAKIMTEASSRFLSPLLDLLFVLIAVFCLLKTNVLRRKASFSAAYGALAMVVVEASFMSLSSTISGINGLLYLGAGQIILICWLLWCLRK